MCRILLWHCFNNLADSCPWFLSFLAGILGSQFQGWQWQQQLDCTPWSRATDSACPGIEPTVDAILCRLIPVPVILVAHPSCLLLEIQGRIILNLLPWISGNAKETDHVVTVPHFGTRNSTLLTEEDSNLGYFWCHVLPWHWHKINLTQFKTMCHGLHHSPKGWVKNQ